MARVHIEADRLVVSPAAPREVPRLASTLRRVWPDCTLDADGNFRGEARSVAEVGALLPAPFHQWSPEAARRLSEESDRLQRHEAARREVAAALSDPLSRIGDYPLAQELDWHQIQVLAVLSIEGLDGLALFDEQGTGKTISCVCGWDFLRRRGAIDQLLVIAPKSLTHAWASALAGWLGLEFEPTLLEGSATRRMEALYSAGPTLVTTYETATRDAELLAAWASRRGQRTLLVADESFFIKNPAAQRSRAVREIRAACARAIVACGTPAPNAPIDVVNQVDLVDRGYAFGSVLRAGQDEAGVIAASLRDRAVFLRRLKRDVLPALPPKEFRTLVVPMSPIQAERYYQTRDGLLEEVSSIDDGTFVQRAASYLAKRAALMQLCSHPGVFDSSYAELPGKFLALDALLKRLIEDAGEKVVLWSFYRFTLEKLAERYRKYGVVRVDGSVADAGDREQAVISFQTEPGTMLFLGNPAAAGAGITLTAAKHAVYESLSNQGAHYLQSIDRIHRRGQTRDVEYHVLLCADSLDVGNYAKLVEKERGAADLLGDDAPRLSRQRFIEDLRSVPPVP